MSISVGTSIQKLPRLEEKMMPEHNRITELEGALDRAIRQIEIMDSTGIQGWGKSFVAELRATLSSPNKMEYLSSVTGPEELREFWQERRRAVRMAEGWLALMEGNLREAEQRYKETFGQPAPHTVSVIEGYERRIGHLRALISIVIDPAMPITDALLDELVEVVQGEKEDEE